MPMIGMQSRPPIPQNRIQTVKKLCAELGFDSPLRQEHHLKEATQNWRKQYVTDNGVPGRDLRKWKDPHVQDDLTAMTKEFLEKGGYGKRLWPTQVKSSTSRWPKYPEEEDRIVDLLKQLFWQQNMNEEHNAKYPDRGRKGRESIERDDSPATLMNSSASKGFRAQLHPPSRPAGFFSPHYDRSAPTALQRATLTNESRAIIPPSIRTRPSEWRSPGPASQLSGSSYVPSTMETDETSTIPPTSTSTPNGSASGSPRPSNEEDIFDVEVSDDDSPRRQKIEASRRIALSYKQAPEPIDNRSRQKDAAPLLQIQAGSSRPLTTPRKERPEQSSSAKIPLAAEAFTEKAYIESRMRKRKDVDGDDEDGDYTPKKRARKQKPPLEERDEMRTTEPGERRESLGSVSQDASTAQHVQPCETALPNRSKGKRPMRGSLTASDMQHPPNDFSIDHAGEDDPMHTAPECMGATDNSSTERQVADTPPFLHDRMPNSGNEWTEENGRPSHAIIPPLVTDGQPDVAAAQAAEHRPRNPASPPTRRPAVKIRYSIIASRHPRFTKIRWPDCSLSDKPIDKLFDKVSALASKKNIERIEFRLITSRSDSRVGISRLQNDVYEDMKQEFSQEIRDDVRRGNLEFDLWMEPDPTGISIGEIEGQVDTGVHDDDFAFSI